MKGLNRSSLVAALTTCSLLLSLCCGILVTGKAAASSGRDGGNLSAKISSDLATDGQDTTLVKVILQLNSKPSGQLNALLNRNGVHVRAHFQAFNSYALELPANVVTELASFSEVAYISLDRQTQSFGHISLTTGADAVRQQTTTLPLGGTTTTTLDGTGIGIAILDSGIDSTHRDFLDKSNGVRVVYSQDFTGEGRTDDPYGHGTHVASIAAGNGRISNGAYIGIAPNANLVNLRVLNAQGTGTVSAVLGALNWVLSNRSTYNVRVVNMSLGMPAVDSYKNDPVCKAVRTVVDAGVVVIAAAGNNGKNSAGQKIYGQIHSPGNEPSAITVGASNTYGTDTRSDDTVTTYSSRGPTRSYWTDASGSRHYDNLIKPDIVAPGNKLVFAEAVNNLIIQQNPQLDAGVSPVDNRKMMFLNGTSMSAPVVAGAAALMLQVNPKLTPNMVKAFLMYSAQPLAGFNMFEQGAGQINIEGAVRLAKLARTDLTAITLVGAPLLTSLTAPTPQTTIAGQTFTWARGLVLGKTYVTGSALITNYQKIYGLGVLLSDGVIVGDGVMVGDNTMLSSGVIVGDNIMTSAGVIVGDGTVFCSTGVIVGDGVLISDGVLLGDGVIVGDGVLVGDGVIVGDAIIQAQSATIYGDASAMPVVTDTGVDYLGY